MSKLIETYPTREDIKNASHIQLCRWHRFLRFPRSKEEFDLTNRMYRRFTELGGMTPEMSKKLGWELSEEDW